MAVVGAGHSSDEENMPGSGFEVVSPEQAENVRSMQAHVQTLGLSPVGAQFLVAQLYASQNRNGVPLNADAIDVLIQLSESTQEPAVERSLGERYLAIGLERLAEERYLRAEQLSRIAGDIEGQALAAEALGSIYEQFGNHAEQVQRLQEAAGLFESLGDSERLSQVQAQIQTATEP
jgi:hypothetical protein